ncbi:MAG: ATP-binding cassette domain-containing protein [Tissierellia bacterium]|nr:ATP-binding cassette domain-containing protein [Tissierellia bacterium]
MSAIVIKDLSKKHRRENILDGLNLEVFEGEFFTLLGQEGAGKTLLARILMNFIKPNGGSASILQMDTRKESKEIKRFCSYVPQEVWIYGNLKPLAIFKKTLAAHGLKNQDEIQNLMDYFNLSNREKFQALSAQDRKKVAIINSLITKPNLLILDEPAKFLSPGMTEKLFKHLKYLQTSEDLTSFVLSDDLARAQIYSDRIGFLDRGQIRGIESMKNKENNDKILRILDHGFNIHAFEAIGTKKIYDDQDNLAFFYDGYLPSLTTVLHQERIQNYSLEDANLSEKLASLSSPSLKEAPQAPLKEEVAPAQVEGEEETQRVDPVEEARVVEDVFKLENKAKAPAPKKEDKDPFSKEDQAPLEEGPAEKTQVIDSLGQVEESPLSQPVSKEETQVFEKAPGVAPLDDPEEKEADK